MKYEEQISKITEAENLLDISSGIILRLNRLGKITLLNKCGSNILGYESGELNNKNWFNACIPKKNRSQIKEVFTQLMQNQGKSVAIYENDVLCKYGSIKTILWHNTVLKDTSKNIIGLLSSGEDITEKLRAEKELHDQEKRISDIVNTSQEWIWTIDLNGIHTFSNPAVERILGYPIDKFVGNPSFSLMHKDVGGRRWHAADLRHVGVPSLVFERKLDFDALGPILPFKADHRGAFRCGLPDVVEQLDTHELRAAHFVELFLNTAEQLRPELLAGAGLERNRHGVHSFAEVNWARGVRRLFARGQENQFVLDGVRGRSARSRGARF